MDSRIELRSSVGRGQGQDSGLRLESETLSGLTLIEEG